MKHVGSVLPELAELGRFDFQLTSHKRKRIETCELVRELRDERRQDLAFHSRPFVLCGLPIRRPEAGKLKYTRRNGRFVLEIVGHPDFGLPFGQDRLIPLWVATLAVRQKSKTILFRSAAEILEEFDLPRDGPHYRRLVDGFKRIFTSTIYFGTQTAANRNQLWDYRRFFHFFDRLKVWYAKEKFPESDIEPEHGNIVSLSDSFWLEIQAHPIPVDLNVVRGLTNNPGCLDLYMWLVWRCFSAKRTENVPLFGAFGLAAQLGVFEYKRDRNFLTDGFGYYSLTNNWNAAEAMQSVYLDFTQNPNYQTLTEGYDYLPGLLKNEVNKAGGDVLLDHAVTKIDRTGGGYMLHIRDREPMECKQVVLAMPRRSLELLDETPFWNWQKPVDGGRGSMKLVDYLQSVIPYPAFKLFLAYDTPWWRQPPISIAAGRSVSDLPIRQTYYFPPVADPFSPPQPGSPLLDGPGLVMASYDDLGAVSYWRSLEDPRDLKPRQRERLRTAAQTMYAGNAKAQSAFDRHVAEMAIAMAEEPGFLPAPAEMIRHAQEQLKYLHFNQPLPDPKLDPHGKPGDLLAAYKDWGHDPYGGGWNFWAPGIDVQKVMRGIRRPFDGEDLFIVGEAYSGNQGWVEGALTTAEHVLRDYFGLRPAAWQPESVYLGY